MGRFNDRSVEWWTRRIGKKVAHRSFGLIGILEKVKYLDGYIFVSVDGYDYIAKYCMIDEGVKLSWNRYGF